MRKADDDLLSLHTLSILADTVSFTETARRLGVTTSAISRRIVELERRHGKKLVRRTSRTVVVTPAGKALVEQAIRAATAIVEGVRPMVVHLPAAANVVVRTYEGRPPKARVGEAVLVLGERRED